MNVPADAVVPVANLAFETSTTHEPGQLGSLANADAICNVRATEAGLPGTFVAWLATSTTTAPSRLGTARGWVRPDGLIVVDTVDDLLVGLMIHPIVLDEHGVDHSYDANPYVATGTDVTGLGPNCTDYTDPAGTVFEGVSALAFLAWTHRTTSACNQPVHLYCFGIDLDVPLVIAPSAGRLAFVSVGTFTPTTGIAAADTICTDEAGSAGLPGSYLAMLPVGGPAAARFDTAGPTWVRRDGVPLAATATDFMNGTLLAPLNVTAAGAYTDADVMTGSDTPLALTVGEDCAVWSSASSGSNLGYASAVGPYMFNATSSNCTVPQPVYCLQQ